MRPAPTRVRNLRPGLHLLETEVPDFDVRAALLVGGERAVVWDTLAHPEQMEPVASLSGGLPITVVYSHADWDHVWGTGGLPGSSAVGERGGVEAVVACEATGLRFRGDVQADYERRRAVAAPGALDAVQLVPPSLTFSDSRTHTADCIVGLVPEWGVLLAGDTVETPLPVVNDGAAVERWIVELERWAAHPGVSSVVPSHGRLGGRELIQETEVYLRSLLSWDAYTFVESEAGETHAGIIDLSTLAPFYARTHARNLRRVAEAAE
jgi:glyoxylase-like metal-dependent hydrolase (beta-lactamase superfamily II)